jgi:hypothetical protein
LLLIAPINAFVACIGTFQQRGFIQMLRLPVSLGAFALAACAPFFAWADTIPVVTPPGLPAGSQYRLVFSTSTGFSATSSNIADYNGFVTKVANAEPALTSLGTQWKAIASTTTTTALENTGTSPEQSVGVPVYNLEGELVAMSNADLWDGTLSADLLCDEHGGYPPAGYTTAIWTGTIWNGEPPDNDVNNVFPLGTSSPAWGQSNLKSDYWIYSSHGSYMASKEMPFYAISGILTAVPEPSSLALAAAAFCSIAAISIRRRRAR